MINFQVNMPVRMDCILEMFLPFQPGKTKQGLKVASRLGCLPYFFFFQSFSYKISNTPEMLEAGGLLSLSQERSSLFCAGDLSCIYDSYRNASKELCPESHWPFIML